MYCQEYEVKLNSKNLLGKGFFSKAYLVEGKVVILTEDPAKECIAHFCQNNNGFIPKMKILDGIGDMQAYEMPLYHKIGAKYKRAWKEYREIKAIIDDCRYHGNLDKYKCFDEYKNSFNRSEVLSEELKEDLVLLVDMMANYTDKIFMEISPRNVKVDENGKLILLDIIGDSHKLEQAWDRKLKRSY